MSQAMKLAEVQFCKNVLFEMDSDLARASANGIQIVPQADLSQESNYFRYLPSIFLLWAQNNPKAAREALKNYYPEQLRLLEVTSSDDFPSDKQIQGLVKELVYPEVKVFLVPFLQNVSRLVGSEIGGTEVERLAFYAASASAALDVILTDEYFDDMGCKKEELARNIQSKLLQFDPVEQEQNLARDSQPSTIKQLMAILSSNTSKEANYDYEVTSLRPNFLPSGGSKVHAARINRRLEALTQQLVDLKINTDKDPTEGKSLTQQLADLKINTDKDPTEGKSIDSRMLSWKKLRPWQH